MCTSLTENCHSSDCKCVPCGFDCVAHSDAAAHRIHTFPRRGCERATHDATTSTATRTNTQALITVRDYGFFPSAPRASSKHTRHARLGAVSLRRWRTPRHHTKNTPGFCTTRPNRRAHTQTDSLAAHDDETRSIWPEMCACMRAAVLSRSGSACVKVWMCVSMPLGDGPTLIHTHTAAYDYIVVSVSFSTR